MCNFFLFLMLMLSQSLLSQDIRKMNFDLFREIKNEKIKCSKKEFTGKKYDTDKLKYDTLMIDKINQLLSSEISSTDSIFLYLDSNNLSYNIFLQNSIEYIQLKKYGYIEIILEATIKSPKAFVYVPILKKKKYITHRSVCTNDFVGFDFDYVYFEKLLPYINHRLLLDHRRFEILNQKDLNTPIDVLEK